ncbi:uncharacterized protein LOC111345832 [Stylophora pistillata]|uniref:uncharacterized protein LOC111345832 n=1 Tax=Stylophora pistillata TaxID=50429 RepID=UPI000C04D484|nr:uncharacterized protein LOC111345832 [Stylophora pistillata]XP_022808858.1 uncharacterized protein LOC111345832 [Stylophora pistillata]XP_022808859.1 uncharacterized protein LOC111345832 [Stylophora pistillata]
MYIEYSKDFHGDFGMKEAMLPSSWKDADIDPVPNEKPIRDVNKHLRPISLTPVLSKLAEGYVVERYVKPAVLARVDANQFGTVPGSNTTIALISMLHSWLCDTDGNGATVQAILLDFHKAFDLIDHKILVRKLMTYSLPSSIITWITDFLTCRRQRVKLSQDCFSEWGSIPSGVPQGTSPGLFVVMIDDQSPTGNCNMWKYVDDTTISEVVQKSQNSDLQWIVGDLSRQEIVHHLWSQQTNDQAYSYLMKILQINLGPRKREATIEIHICEDLSFLLQRITKSPPPLRSPGRLRKWTKDEDRALIKFIGVAISEPSYNFESSPSTWPSFRAQHRCCYLHQGRHIFKFFTVKFKSEIKSNKFLQEPVQDPGRGRRCT